MKYYFIGEIYIKTEKNRVSSFDISFTMSVR